MTVWPLNFLTEYNINTFEEKNFFFLWRPIVDCKIPKKRDQRVALSGFWLLIHGYFPSKVSCFYVLMQNFFTYLLDYFAALNLLFSVTLPSFCFLLFFRCSSAAIIILSKSTWYVMFSQTKFQIGINICHKTLLQWVQFKPHSSTLTNIESLTSNIRQSFQICRRKKEKEENNGNYKAFCVTRKRNKY